MELRKAERQQAKIKMGIQGPSGSGKTYSALLIAYGITGKWDSIAIIDTENHSADLYAHLGNYSVLSLNKPFSPERYIEAIQVCEDANKEVIIIDSISHEWEGSGGILELHSAMAGNSFTNWSKMTPRHNAFIQKILQSDAHIITTIRAKQDYVLTEKNGKYVPEKVGLRGVTREGMDYELTLVFELDIKHFTQVSKDRTMLFMDKPSFIITKETGTTISNWCLEGIDISMIIEKINQAGNLEDLRTIHMKYPRYSDKIKQELVRRSNEIGKCS